MTTGETKTFTVDADNAYGPHIPEATTTISKEVFPEDFVFNEWMTVPLQGPDGQVHQAMLTNFTDDTVVADFNHPMAGKDLTF